jgi:hypothetical protein
MAERELSSAGHKLGQLVGDWYEEHFVLPLLQEVAARLRLDLDHRFRTRPARTGDKIIWKDEDGNGVDFDFVMELDGTDDERGIPIAFFECFWRRGTRHSRDKVRDDSGKLLPMRDTYPTARFLGILAGGDVTKPARLFLQTRDIGVFYVPKSKIVDAFGEHGLQMDYPDRLPEEQKAQLADAFQRALTPAIKRTAAATLRRLVGETSIRTYVDRVLAALGALPQELRFIAQHQSKRVVFESIPEATAFLREPSFDFSLIVENFIYEITYSDGTEFERQVATLDELRTLHAEIDRLSQHVAVIAAAQQ